MKPQSLVAATVLVAGCASVPEYTAPAGVPRARLTLDRGDLKAAVISFWTEGSNCTAPQMLGQKFWDGQPVEIPAGKELAIGMATIVDTSALSTTTCGTQAISFVPSANDAYTAKYLADRAAKTCRMTLVRAGGGEEPAARRRTPTNDSDRSSPGCT